MEFEYLNDYKGLGRAVFLRGYGKELIVTLDVGPRILRFSAEGYQNVFAEDVQEADVLPDGSVCHVYGGFRICHCPETFPRSYISDSHPVESYSVLGDSLVADAQPEVWTQMQKRLRVTLRPEDVEVQIGIKNTGAWAVQCAAWGISACAPGSTVVFAGSSEDTGYLPNRSLIIWPYTKMQDARMQFFDAYHVVHCDPARAEPLKLGCRNTQGWAAAFVHQQCYIKRFAWEAAREYPDFGCNFETYDADWGVEVESLSPLQIIEPNQTLWHTECWEIHPGISLPTAMPQEAELHQILQHLGLVETDQFCK